MDIAAGGKNAVSAHCLLGIELSKDPEGDGCQSAAQEEEIEAIIVQFRAKESLGSNEALND